MLKMKAGNEMQGNILEIADIIPHERTSKCPLSHSGLADNAMKM